MVHKVGIVRMLRMGAYDTYPTYILVHIVRMLRMGAYDTYPTYILVHIVHMLHVHMGHVVHIVQNCVYGAYEICDDLEWSSKDEFKHMFINVV
jgi:hypothetical protein